MGWRCTGLPLGSSPSAAAVLRRRHATLQAATLPRRQQVQRRPPHLVHREQVAAQRQNDEAFQAAARDGPVEGRPPGPEGRETVQEIRGWRPIRLRPPTRTYDAPPCGPSVRADGVWVWADGIEQTTNALFVLPLHHGPAVLCVDGVRRGVGIDEALQHRVVVVHRGEHVRRHAAGVREAGRGLGRGRVGVGPARPVHVHVRVRRPEHVRQTAACSRQCWLPRTWRGPAWCARAVNPTEPQNMAKWPFWRVPLYCPGHLPRWQAAPSRAATRARVCSRTSGPSPCHPRWRR